MSVKKRAGTACIKHSAERTVDMKPTKEQFEDYVFIRDSGVTNMWAVDVVCSMSTTGLTTDICLYIMKHFEELAEEYNVCI